MRKFLINAVKMVYYLGALPMVLFVYAIFLKANAEDLNPENEKHFINVTLQKCIIVYYVALALMLIWR